MWGDTETPSHSTGIPAPLGARSPPGPVSVPGATETRLSRRGAGCGGGGGGGPGAVPGPDAVAGGPRGGQAGTRSAAGPSRSTRSEDAMEEAQRLLTVSVWKLYRCRLRRGGLRLHRSLQLSLLVRAARHRYLSARAAAETLPGPEPAGAAAGGATPEAGSDPSGDPRCPNTPSADRLSPCSHRTDPSGDPRCPNTPSADRPSPWSPRTDPSGELRCPNTPSADRPSPRTEQERGNPLRHWSGDHPTLPSGARRSERHRGCLPGRPTEDSPSPPAGDSPAPPTAELRPAPDPANRDRDLLPTADPRAARDPANWDPPSAAPGPPRPTGAPRAGQKRRSSGSAGPGRGPVPSKRARLEAEAPPLPPGPPGRCSGPPAAAFGFLVRAVGAC
ncbi:immediate early response gene 2 protein [Taeniopygia guttata]|uniref:immediate early response gene 2 protein n=1 Tax=Taeniopygia guttata TaxID=59729 RepID=UPI0011AEFF47|nr:immediate early response gene 2 protein [Taeniopygia guttata]